MLSCEHMIALIAILVIAIAALICALLWMTSIIFTKAPFVPIPNEVIKNIIDALGVQEKDVVYDIGCGDGRVICAIARAHPQAICIGIEHATLPYFLARVRARRIKNVQIRFANVFNEYLADADKIFTYLFPGLMNMLLPKLTQELHHGSRCVSADFPFAHKKPTHVIDDVATAAKRGTRLYIYDF